MDTKAIRTKAHRDADPALTNARQWDLKDRDLVIALCDEVDLLRSIIAGRESEVVPTDPGLAKLVSEGRERLVAFQEARKDRDVSLPGSQRREEASSTFVLARRSLAEFMTQNAAALLDAASRAPVDVNAGLVEALEALTTEAEIIRNSDRPHLKPHPDTVRDARAALASAREATCRHDAEAEEKR